MKEWFSQTCVYTLKEYILYQVVSLKLQNYSSQWGSCVYFSEKNVDKLFWVMEETNEVRATNSFMNLSHA